MGHTQAISEGGTSGCCDCAMAWPMRALWRCGEVADETRWKVSVSGGGKSLQPDHHRPAADRRPRSGQMGSRTELGWQFDHFIGYFGITLFFCFAWPRPFVVGGIVMVVAVLLEGLQALTPDRSANLEAALWGAGGASVAALLAELIIRVWRLGKPRKFTTLDPLHKP